MKNRMINYTK